MKLKELRENAGLRQADIAKKLRVRVSAVSNWEHGLNGIASKYIKTLARLYGVTAAEIRAASEQAQAQRISHRQEIGGNIESDERVDN